MRKDLFVEKEQVCISLCMLVRGKVTVLNERQTKLTKTSN